MNRVLFTLFCSFTVAHLKQITNIPTGVKSKPQPVPNAVLKEQIHDKIAYIAAIADLQHVKFKDHLKSIASRNLHKSEAEVMKLIQQHMINVIKRILPDLKILIQMTDNREQSAFEVNKHFGEDHVEPMLQAIFGVEKKHPKFCSSLRKRIADSAQAQIRLIFNLQTRLNKNQLRVVPTKHNNKAQLNTRPLN